MRAVLSVPERGDGPWPLLVFLHGYDEGAPADLQTGVTRHGPLRAGNPSIVTDELIVVAPQLPFCGDAWAQFGDEVLALCRDVPDADRSRFYLTGFSFGGNGVFDLAGAQPGVWAAAWAVDPTRVPSHDPGIPMWVSAGALARRRGHDFRTTLSLTDDPGADRVWRDEGHDHVGCATAAYRDTAIYAWLLARTTPDRRVDTSLTSR